MRHVARGSRIVIHGDYDVDGVCSTAVLARALRRLGAEPVCELPSRFDEGYGLSAAGVERQASAGTDLLVTVDCGITAVDEVAHARALGMEVVVTDHHRPGERLPDCTVVHPALGGYPFADLCAAGVAYKLAEALADAAGMDPAQVEEDLDLVALATVCDVVPLVGENRRIVRDGLVAIARTRKPGLRALMQVDLLRPRRARRGRARLPARAAHQRGGADAPARRRARAAAHRGRGPCGRDRRRARPPQPRAAGHRDAHHVRRRGGARPARPPARVRPRGRGLAPGRHRDRGVADGRAPLPAVRVDRARRCRRGPRVRPQHLGVRPARRAGRLCGAPRPFRRPPDGGRIRHRGRCRAGVSARVRPARGGSADPARPAAGGAGRCARPGGGARARPRRGARAARAVRTPQPVPDAARAGGAGRGPPADGRRETARALHGGERRRPGARRRVQDERRVAEGMCRRAAGHRGAARAQRVERDGRAAARPQGALRTARGRVRGARRRARSVGAPRAAARTARRRRPRPPAGRETCDRRGEGVAGVLGDLLASGEDVLVACGEPQRWRRGLDSTLAGLARGRAAIASWDLLALLPSLAEPYPHVFALDPPPVEDGPSRSSARSRVPVSRALRWGAGGGGDRARNDRRLARTCARLSPAVYRALRDAGPVAREASSNPSSTRSLARGDCAFALSACCSSSRS